MPILDLDIDIDNAEFEEDLHNATQLRGTSNYLLWRYDIAEIFDYHFLNHYLTINDDSDSEDEDEELDPEVLSYISACIESTFHDDLNFCVWQELGLDSRKLWKELDDRFSPKGKWAYIRCTVKLNRMQPWSYRDDDQYCRQEKLLVMQRKASGVQPTRDIEDMVRIVEDLPDYLEYLMLKWCVAEEEDLTAAKMCQQVMLAEERYTMPKEDINGGANQKLDLMEPRILGSDSPEAGGLDG
tara:strand:+ start:1492 stop:2214 length:723 start_codon:yes stop_codon:yes gene_type:complete